MFDMKRRNIKVFLQLILIGTIFMGLAFFIGNNDKKNHCTKSAFFKEKAIQGRIISRALDTLNHAYPYIVLNPDIDKVYFELEANHVFDSLQVGDEVNKPKDSDTIWVTRNSRVFFFIADYGCH